MKSQYLIEEAEVDSEGPVSDSDSEVSEVDTFLLPAGAHVHDDTVVESAKEDVGSDWSEVEA